MDNEGRFWIRRSTTYEHRELWALLTPRGVPLTTMALPPQLSLMAVRGDLVFLRAEQADGFQSLLRCRMPQR